MDVLISSSWNASGNQWIFSYKEENEYNQSDLLSESVISYYSSSPPYAWLPQMKWLYTYNASNFLIERLQKQWSQQTNDWELNYKNDLVYDAFQNLIEQISSQWNSATSTWEYDDKVAGIYNNNYSFSDLLLPFWFEEMFDFFNHMLLSYEEYDFNGSSWVLYDTRDLYYSAVNVIGLKEENLSAFVLYPNPAESYIRIMLPEQMTHATLEIHDLSGRLISRHNITHDAMIPVYHLPKGLYIYRINRSTSYGKLIVN
jgi:hypothetical protein